MTSLLAIIVAVFLLPWLYAVVKDREQLCREDMGAFRLLMIYVLCFCGGCVVLLGACGYCVYDEVRLACKTDRWIYLFFGILFTCCLLSCLLLCGCTSAVKTPVVTNKKSLVSETAGVSLSAPMPQPPQVFPSKPVVHGCTNCPTNPYINTNWPVYRLSWTASPTPSVSYQVWQSSGLKSLFTLAGTTTNLFWPVDATNAEGFFKVRSILNGITSRWAT